MPNFRRANVAGGTFFFTLVTAGRAPILCEPQARTILRRCLRTAQERRRFQLDAIILLPDHLHTIWTLPSDDRDFSIRWADVKANFTRDWLRQGGIEQRTTRNQRRQGRRAVLQPRFMEHTIRDDNDLFAHLDYIHFNAVKHGLVRRPVDWLWSSFHRYVRMGWYERGWGCAGHVASLDRIDDALLE